MNITQAHIAKVKKKVPGSLLLAYWCLEYIPIYTTDTGDCSAGHIHIVCNNTASARTK